MGTSQSLSDAARRGAIPAGVNVGRNERLVSAGIGSALVLFGLRRRSLLGLALATLGAELVRRGATGHCYAYDALGDNRAHGPVRPLMMEHTVRVARDPRDLYGWWRRLENLPLVMPHLQSVRVFDDGRSHWKATLFGRRLSWDATIVTDIENELIGWRSLAGSDVEHSGSVAFRPVEEGKATNVTLTLAYHLPGGLAGKALGAVAGGALEKQIARDLDEFRRLMEGEIRAGLESGGRRRPEIWQ